MWKSYRAVLPVGAAACVLAACHTAPTQAAAPVPEAEQVVSRTMKNLYMAASAAPRQSAEQQKRIEDMARTADNGKELLLVMRAARGVFPSPESPIEKDVRATVTARMMKVATLAQLIEYAAEYPVEPANSRRYIERMFDLAKRDSDTRVWHRIQSAAFRLGAGDLAQQAQARADQLSPRQ